MLMSPTSMEVQWQCAFMLNNSPPQYSPCCSSRIKNFMVRCNKNNSGNEKSHKGKKVLILGATGRVGGSTARALSRLCPSLQLFLGGRNKENGAKLAEELGKNSQFCEVDIYNSKALNAALDGMDLVVHAAGPFQRAESCTVLEAAILNKIAYIDACDDGEYSRHAKMLHKKALDAGVPAIITAGIYPGVSNVMAAELVRLARTNKDVSYEPERLRFSYFTAGSGGAGPTILATSFLLLGDEVIAYYKGKQVRAKPYSSPVDVDFGKGVGKRPVFLLNLPEIGSTHKVLGVPTVSARFGTSPFFWNWAMKIVANLDFVKDRSKVKQLAELFYPIVQSIDRFTGERMSIRVDLECNDGRKTVGIFSHKKLSVCVGVSLSAFARAVLEDSTQPGVWFPEEPEGIAVDARKQLLERASEGTFNFALNRPPWMVESNPKEIGFGIYVE